MAFGGKAKQKHAPVPKHGYARLPDVVAPSEAIEWSRQRQGYGRILWGTLFAGLMLNAGVAAALIRSARVDPYVADGGVFGCPVPVVTVGLPQECGAFGRIFGCPAANGVRP